MSITPPPNAVTLPAIPQKVIDAGNASEITSTPANRCSASSAEHLANFRVADVNPMIFQDVKSHQTCDVESLLDYMLRRCCGPNPPDNLLKQCLDVVLPYCNGGYSKPKNRKDKTPDYLIRMRESLTEYCSTREETKRYAPFVSACNYALAALRDISVLPHNPSKICFHVNDPSLIHGDHNVGISKRKPDVVLVTEPSARAADQFGELSEWEPDIAFITALKQPYKSFQWADVLSSLEFKAVRSYVKGPPVEYKLKKPLPISAEPTPETWDIEEYQADGLADSPIPQPSPNVPVTLSPSEPPSSTQAAPENRNLRARVLDSQALRTGPVTRSGQSEKNSDPSSRKRKAENLEPENPKKPKQQKPHAMVQSALYAAERLSSAFWITHVLNLVIVDDIAHLWWYDRQGAIQSTGLNFIQDLPYFLVLLLALDRFTLQDWGVAEEFRKQETSDKISFKFSEGVDVEIDPSDRLFGHYGLVGRATKVFGATSESRRPQPQIGISDLAVTEVPEAMDEVADPESLGNVHMVVKISWPEESRASEADIIRHAVAVGKDDRDIADHLPDLICSQDLKYATGTIRSYLGIDDAGSRIMRTLLFRRLYHITDLVGKQFWVAFWEIVRCHYKLWGHNIRHRDVSFRNLMYEKVLIAQSECPRGKLNDFDLASHGDPTGPTGTDRTGTMPFMALELLTAKAADGNLVHEYKHDLESFGWVLLWIFARFERGKKINKPPFDSWLATDYFTCRTRKIDPLERLAARPTRTYKAYWPQATKFVQFFCNRFWVFFGDQLEEVAASDSDDQSASDEQSPVEQSPAENVKLVPNYGNDSKLLAECLKKARIKLPIPLWWTSGEDVIS